jgi:hypothetical protein
LLVLGITAYVHEHDLTISYILLIFVNMCLVFLVKEREFWAWHEGEIRGEESRFGGWGRRNLGLDF